MVTRTIKLCIELCVLTDIVMLYIAGQVSLHEGLLQVKPRAFGACIVGRLQLDGRIRWDSPAAWPQMY